MFPKDRGYPMANGYSQVHPSCAQVGRNMDVICVWADSSWPTDDKWPRKRWVTLVELRFECVARIMNLLTGDLVKDDFRINKTNAVYNDKTINGKLVKGGCHTPVIQKLSSTNGFMIVWSAFNQDGDLQGIFGRIWDQDFVGEEKEFQINTTHYYDQRDPDICELSGRKRYAIVWQSYRQNDVWSWDVVATIRDRQGDELVPEFTVNVYRPYDQHSPKAVCLFNKDRLLPSKVVFIYVSRDDNKSEGIRARVASESLQFYGNEWIINSGIIGEQTKPSAAVLVNGQ